MLLMPTYERNHPALRFLRQSFKFGLIALLAAWSLFPIVWNIMTSFKSRSEIFSIPPTFLFIPNTEAWQQALTPGSRSVYPTLTNSLVVSVGTTVLTLVVSSLGAYAFARYKFRGKLVIFSSMLATRLLPPIAAVVPLFHMMRQAGLIDTYLVLILIYSALHAPFAIWLLKSFIESVPTELEESARVEGCNTIQAFRHVTLPLIVPGLASTAAFVFILAWNEFMYAFLFTTMNVRTLPVKLSEVRGESIVAWQDMAAQSTILMIPTFILALYLQKYLVKGLTQGSVK
ncbi:MAG: carbohydrate ABC transporter permease [Dehalococcoidia bacterium]